MAEQHQQKKPSDGSRSRTGCITCRIRKKKCDEQRPGCYACWSRGLACYGFNVPAPIWYNSKASWKEVRDSVEAQRLRTFAENRYKLSRKVGSKIGSATTITLSTYISEKNDGENTLPYSSLQLPNRPTPNDVRMLPSVVLLEAGVNIWQLRPETVWWDSKIRDLTSDHSSSSHDETRLLMIYLDVIHPITHTFDRLDSSSDRSWMLERLVSKQALYCSTLSISACFETSLTQPPSINDIGICSKVRRLQSRAIFELQKQIDEFVMMKTTPVEDFVWAGIQLLDVVTQLETLEIFSMLQGYWEIHHQAARRILNHIEICAPTKHQNSGSNVSAIGSTLSSLRLCDTRRRSLEFSICNFIWVDVLATSTFGALSYISCAFDYLELLRLEIIKPEKLMGCQGWVMAIVLKISRLEQWKVMHQDQMPAVDIKAELVHQSKQLREELIHGIDKLENDQKHTNSTSLEEDIRLVSIIWAYGAQVLLQVTIIDVEANQFDMESNQFNIDQTFVNICLQRLEYLPTRLVMRTSWPYTIAGSMALSEAQHVRFRRIVSKTLQEAQPPGISWKGLAVMEECWRLRRSQGQKNVGWREGMESLGARVILT
jgi:C6 transcription factor Pro1